MIVHTSYYQVIDLLRDPQSSIKLVSLFDMDKVEKHGSVCLYINYISQERGTLISALGHFINISS